MGGSLQVAQPALTIPSMQAAFMSSADLQCCSCALLSAVCLEYSLNLNSGCGLCPQTCPVTPLLSQASPLWVSLPRRHHVHSRVTMVLLRKHDEPRLQGESNSAAK